MPETQTTENVLEITPSAVAKIKALMDSRDLQGVAVRVVLRGRLPGGAYQTEFKFIPVEEQKLNDMVQDTGQFLMFFDAAAARAVGGAVVDFDEERYAAGFNIEYPAAGEGSAKRPQWKDPLAKAAQKVIDDLINPGVAGHGGWVLLLDVKDDTAYIEMGGGCQGCALSYMTLKEGIENLIKQHVPQIAKVVDITEHADGTNPYYTPSALGESPFA